MCWLDKILIIYEFNLSYHDIQLISLASFLISAKINETLFLKIHILENLLGNNKFSKDNIKSTELLILTKLKYKIPKNYFVEYIHILNLLKFGKEDTFYKRIALKYSSKIYSILLNDYYFLKSGELIRKLKFIYEFSLFEIKDFNVLSESLMNDFIEGYDFYWKYDDCIIFIQNKIYENKS